MESGRWGSGEVGDWKIEVGAEQLVISKWRIEIRDWRLLRIACYVFTCLLVYFDHVSL